ELLEAAPKAYDCCFIDPARRVGSEKVFLIQDCQPDLLSLQEELFQRVERCLVKLSPMLDIKAGIRALHHVKAVYVVGVQGECKAILIEQSAIDAPKNPDPDQVPIHVVILDDKERNLSFT